MTIGIQLERRASPGSQSLRCCCAAVTRGADSRHFRAICGFTAEAQDKEQESGSASKNQRERKDESASGNRKRARQARINGERCRFVRRRREDLDETATTGGVKIQAM